LKRALRLVIRLFIGFSALIVLYFIIGLILSIVPTNPSEVTCRDKQEVFISSNGIHLDIVVPTAILSEENLKAMDIPDRAKFVSFGWGDKGFYLKTPTWSDLKFTVAFNALFFESESAMHIDYFYHKSKSWTSVSLCDSQYLELMNFVFASFERDQSGDLLPIQAPGYGDTDTFYEARGSYNLVKTCNEWVNIGLKRSEVKTSVWSPFEFGVLYHLEGEE